MNELQKKLLEMLIWFHSFCVREKLRYYIVYGSCLGAMRHGGFIPWDDDLDVAMPRADYRKLQSIFAAQNNQIDKYRLETPHSPTIDFIYPFGKLFDTTTTLVEETRRFRILRGVFLDVFPLDGAGNKIGEAQRFFRNICIANLFRMVRISKISAERSIISNFSTFLAGCVPACIADDKMLAIKIDEMSQIYDFDSCDYVGALTGVRRMKDVMPRAYFGKPTLYKFEGYDVYGPELADDYLKQIYGDWRAIRRRRKHPHMFPYLDLFTPWEQHSNEGVM